MAPDFGTISKNSMNFGAVHLGGLPLFGAVLAPNGNFKEFGAVFSILAPCLLAPFGAKIELKGAFGAVWRQS